MLRFAALFFSRRGAPINNRHLLSGAALSLRLCVGGAQKVNSLRRRRVNRHGVDEVLGDAHVSWICSDRARFHAPLVGFRDEEREKIFAQGDSH
mmetsp:Transcript_117685/g.332966  ORF Transcript_117685/g.332966 Transcript_117685/m.332966 type:complete len:94 (+) Transcript_117685:735-1016(+)